MGLEVTVKPLQLMGLPPSPREGHIMLALDAHRILVFGGGSISPVFGPQQFNDMFLLDLKESKWSHISSKGDQPSPRTGQSAVLLDNGQVLIFGGSSMTQGYMNDVYVLDTKEWIWSTPPVKGKPPSPRDKHAACLVGSKMYVCGGFGPSAVSENGVVNEGSDDDADAADALNEDSGDEDESAEDEDDDGPSMSFTWYNDMHVLDVISMEWQELETLGAKPTPRAAHAAFIASIKDRKSSENKDMMIMFGGRDPNGRQNDLFTLDLQSLEWKKESSKAPPARSFHVMLPLGGSQLAVSYGGMGVEGGMFPGLELLNLRTMEWTSLKSSSGVWPPLRGACAMVASLINTEESKLIIFGGSCSLEDQETVYYNDAYAMDVSPLLKSAY